jgi:hypothetical protein
VSSEEWRGSAVSTGSRSPAHFRAAYGTSPHRFQVGRRLARPRK